jgi:hypothetical protein
MQDNARLCFLTLLGKSELCLSLSYTVPLIFWTMQICVCSFARQGRAVFCRANADCAFYTTVERKSVYFTLLDNAVQCVFDAHTNVTLQNVSWTKPHRTKGLLNKMFL